MPSYYFENNHLEDMVDAINKAITECSGECETFYNGYALETGLRP